MKRWFLLILLFPLLARAQFFSASDTRQLKMYSTGIFSNDKQAAADAHFVKSQLKVQPIWPKRKDGVWLFAERTDTAHYYQLWHFYVQDDTTLLMQFLDFKDTLKAAALSRDIKSQSGLFIYHLATRHGCELYLKKTKTGYNGSTLGKDCFAALPGTEYLVVTMAFSKNTIGWQENGYDKNDALQRSNFNGNYTFTRQAKSLK